MVGGQRRELERSVAAQKMLLQQVQEQEAEAGELQDFLQAEKATLQEALKEAETEVQRLNAELSTKEDATKEMEEQAGLLVRRAEQAKQEALMLCMYPPHPHSVDDEFQEKNMFRFHILTLLFDYDNKQSPNLDYTLP